MQGIEITGPSSVGRMLSRWPYSGPRGKQENEVRRLICKAIYWLIEPLLDLIEQGRRERSIREATRMTPEEARASGAFRLTETPLDSVEGSFATQKA